MKITYMDWECILLFIQRITDPRNKRIISYVNIIQTHFTMHIVYSMDQNSSHYVQITT